MIQQAAVVTTGICKVFPSGDTTVTILHDINLTIGAGELTLLVGPSGCGKTTLLSIITGILSPTQGHVRIYDTELTTLSDRRQVLFRRTQLGFIFQQYHLLPALTAAENAAIPLIAAGVNMRSAVAQAATFLSRIGLQNHVDKYPWQLSGGQQQRVAIARALVHNPRFVVCDEPTAALDAQTGLTVMELLRDIAKEPQRAVLVVTHDNRIFHFADRIIHMSDGRIEREERPASNRATGTLGVIHYA